MTLEASHTGTPAHDRFADLKASDLTEQEKRTVIELALSVLAARHRRGRALESPKAARSYLQLKCADYEREVFGCLFLDTRHRVLEWAELFAGSIDSATVHPRVVVQRALAVNAAAVVIFHNHPSGVAEPSAADQSITRRLVDALALVDVRVLDHLVVGHEACTSMAELGLL